MLPWSHPQHALRCAWVNLSTSSTTTALSNFVTFSPLRSHNFSRTVAPILLSRSLHLSTHLSRQRRWRDGDDDATITKRDTTDTDNDYIHYTARIQPLTTTTTHEVLSPTTITPTSTILTSPTSSPVVHLTATPESTEPPPSSTAYRDALFAARDARRAQALLAQSVHSSGPSRRVRKWQSNQKRLRTRADRRRRKYHMNQSYEREQDALIGSKRPHMHDEQ